MNLLLDDTLPNLVSTFSRGSDRTTLVEACAIFIVLIIEGAIMKPIILLRIGDTNPIWRASSAWLASRLVSC